MKQGYNMNDMEALKKSVLDGYDLLASQLLAYDDVTEGGYCLLCSDQFNEAAREKLSAEQRERIFEVSLAVHDFLKAADVSAWWKWFCNKHGQTTPRAKLEASLASGRKILESSHLYAAVNGTRLPAAFFDRGARIVDDLAARLG